MQLGVLSPHSCEQLSIAEIAATCGSAELTLPLSLESKLTCQIELRFHLSDARNIQ